MQTKHLLHVQAFQECSESWEAWLDRVFERLDANSNGKIDLLEIMECAFLNHFEFDEELRCQKEAKFILIFRALLFWYMCDLLHIVYVPCNVAAQRV